MVSGRGKSNLQMIGQKGEQEAARFLLDKGYEIVEKNFSTRRGEIDIIAWHEKHHHGKTLCFVEVKTRSGEAGSAERATSAKKIIKMKKAAREYCLQRGISIDKVPIQFEHVSVYTGGAKIKTPVCRLFEIPMS